MALVVPEAATQLALADLVLGVMAQMKVEH
jgi:hypothetical protein